MVLVQERRGGFVKGFFGVGGEEVLGGFERYVAWGLEKGGELGYT